MRPTGQQAAAQPGGQQPGFPDVDMSHLSEEERLLIESVMAKAQMEEMADSVKSPPGNNARQVSLQLQPLQSPALFVSLPPRGARQFN